MSINRAVGVLRLGALGNIASICGALEAVGAQVSVVERPDQLDATPRLLLPGVGSFPEAMAEINSHGWLQPLRQAASSKPTLGICLGMQLLARVGFEFAETDGLALLAGEVRRMQCKAPVPHIGFAGVTPVGSPAMLAQLPADAEFYFMHSYQLINYTDVAALADYGSHQFVAAVERDQLFGVQFHPEKSRDVGLQLLRNFVEFAP